MLCIFLLFALSITHARGCTHTHTRTHTHTHTHIHTQTYTHTHTHTNMQVHRNVCACIHTHTNVQPTCDRKCYPKCPVYHQPKLITSHFIFSSLHLEEEKA